MANFITILRIVASPVFVLFMIRSNENPAYRYLALAVFIFGSLTDWADGFIARKTNTVTRFGIVADPLADRIFIGTALVTLYAMRILPFVFMVVVLGRDLIMALGYPFIGKLDRDTVAVHWTGKVATAILFVALTCLVLSSAPHDGARFGFEGFKFSDVLEWQTYGLWLFVVGMFWSIVSGIIYVSRTVFLLYSGTRGRF